LCDAQVNEGVVVAVGPGRRDKAGEIIPNSVKEGDRVLLPEYGGNLVKLEGKECALHLPVSLGNQWLTLLLHLQVAFIPGRGHPGLADRMSEAMGLGPAGVLGLDLVIAVRTSGG
jgi:hypothetical protein